MITILNWLIGWDSVDEKYYNEIIDEMLKQLD
jgi:hypothetical protein